MAQEQIWYALVAEWGTGDDGPGFRVVAAHGISRHSKRLPGITREVLSRLRRRNTTGMMKAEDESQQLRIAYKVLGTHLYLCAADREFKRRILVEFLESLEESYIEDAPRGKAVRRLLREKLDHFNDLSQDEMHKARQEIDQIKGIMEDNIDSLLTRESDLGQITESAGLLAEQSFEFQTESGRVKNAMRKQCIIIFGVVCCLLCVVIIVIILVGYGVGCLATTGSLNPSTCFAGGSKKKS